MVSDQDLRIDLLSEPHLLKVLEVDLETRFAYPIHHFRVHMIPTHVALDRLCGVVSLALTESDDEPPDPVRFPLGLDLPGRLELSVVLLAAKLAEDIESECGLDPARGYVHPEMQLAELDHLVKVEDVHLHNDIDRDLFMHAVLR